MKTIGTVVFDIIGTCFSLDSPRTKLVELGAPAYALQLWFAQTLRDAFALSHAGGYRPLKEVLEAELPRTLKMLGVSASSTELSRVVNSFGELEPQPEGFTGTLKVIRRAIPNFQDVQSDQLPFFTPS